MGPTTTGYADRLAGNLLRIARAQTGVSQRELAAAANVPQSTIARIESGARQPSLPLLVRILAAVELEPRITLESYDAHDDILDTIEEHMTATQRAARRAAQGDFVARLRSG